MSYVFYFLIFCLIIGKVIGKLAGNTLFSESNDFETYKPTKESPTIINNYTTNIQQNLNVTEEQLNKLKKS